MSGGDRPAVHPLAAVGFDRAAEVYERSRPSYPAAALGLVVRDLGIGPGRRVVDLGAGTGKLTRLLVAAGADVVALEPVAGMRDQLVRAAPGAAAVGAVAESLPLAPASVDAVVCAQAWHWFDAGAALAEVHRVLRPGGGLAVVFNIRDESVAWVRELTDVTEFATAVRPHHAHSRRELPGQVAAAGGFGPVEVTTFRYGQELDEDGLVARVASQSNVASMPPERRAAILDEVRHLARTHPDLAGRHRFELPYETEVALCHRR